jgi:tRNA(fMet)-specific endonuclease VapC
MGTLLDTTVFIDIERAGRGKNWLATFDEMSQELERQLGPVENVGIAAITVSELLHGVHLATQAVRPRREAFVEAVIASFPPIPFDTLAARSHARIWAELVASGEDIGAHDRLVASTAIASGWKVATANIRHFDRVPGLDVVAIQLFKK